MNDSKQNSLLILGIIEGTPAERAGVQVGDRIFSVDGVPIAGPQDYVDAVAKRTNTVKLTVLRGSKVLELEMRYG